MTTILAALRWLGDRLLATPLDARVCAWPNLTDEGDE